MEADQVDLSAGGTLPTVWLDRWTADPQRSVVFDSRHGWVSGADLTQRAQQVAQRLTVAGVRPGDRVLISGPSCVELVATHAAVLAMGAVAVPLNSAYRAAEVRAVASDCRAKAALIEGIADREEWHEQLRAVNRDALIGSLDAAELSGGSGDGAPAAEPGSTPGDAQPATALGGGAAEGGLAGAARVRSPGDPALIGYTSGTTGRPKGAVLSHANLLASVRALELAWRWTPDDVLVLALPLFHIHGLGIGLHGTLTVGARAVLLRAFEPDTVFDAMAQHRATLFFGVPTMYSRLAASPRAAELSSLRLCVSGSAPMAPDLHEAVRRASGQQVLERYGMTETLMLVSNPCDEPRRAGTVGFPLPGVELRLDPASSERAAAEHGTDAAGGPAGGVVAEIQVRGPNVFSGYWERPEADAFDEGWFRTGDLGCWDDGYLRIVGRAKDLIISGGFNVYPREVEEVIAAHPEIAECAVAGEPDPHWGEVVVAYVVAARDFADGELMQYVGDRLAYYKRPRRTRRIAMLPRNALGKVQRHQLAAAWARAGPGDQPRA